MAAKKRYSPDAEAAIGVPKYEKPKQVQPYNLIGAAGPPIGQDAIGQLGDALYLFNKGGLSAISSKTAYEQQRGLEMLPELEKGVLDAKLAIVDKMKELGAPMLGADHVWSQAISKAGGNRARPDLDAIFWDQNNKDFFASIKDDDEFPKKALKHVMDQSIEYLEDNDPKHAVSKLFRKGYDPVFKAGAMQGLAGYNEAWAQRGENKVRMENIRTARDHLHDAIEDHLDGGAINEALRSFETSIYKGYYGDWPVDLEKGITYNRDLWEQVIQPVFQDALENPDIDIDQLVTLYEKVGKLRRPTDKGSTEFFGKFREEADAWYNKAYDTATTRHTTLGNRNRQEAEQWGRDVVEPLFWGIEHLGPEAQKELKDIGIQSFDDVNMTNLHEFLDAMSTDDSLFQLLDTPAGDRQDWAFMNEQLTKITGSIHSFAAKAYDAKAENLADIDAELTKMAWNAPYIQHILPFFRKEFFPKVMKENWSSEQAVNEFLKEYDVPDMFLATNPNHTVERQKLMGILQSIFTDKFFSGEDNEGKMYIETYLKNLNTQLSHGNVPKGSIEELRSMMYTGLAKSEKQMSDIKASITHINKMQENQGIYQHPDLKPDKIITQVSKFKMDAGSTSSLFAEVVYWDALSTREAASDQTGHGYDEDMEQNLLDNAPKIARAGRVMKVWRRDIEKKAIGLIDEWLETQKDMGVVEPPQIKSAWDKDGKNKINEALLNHFGSPEMIKIYEQLYESSADEQDQTQGILNSANPDGSFNLTGLTDEASAAYAMQMEGVQEVMKGYSNKTLNELTPIGSGRNLALEAYVGQKGDRLVENSVRLQKHHAETVQKVTASILDLTKLIRDKQNNPIENKDIINTTETTLRNQINFLRASRMKYEGIDWKKVNDGTMNFDIKVGGEHVEIPVTAGHIDLNTVMPVQSWEELEEYRTTYDQLEQAATAGGVTGEGVGIPMMDALNEAKDPDKYKTLVEWNDFLGSVQNINLLNPDHISRVYDLERYRKLATGWRQKMIAIHPDKLPPAHSVELKDLQLANMFGSKGWRKDGDLKAPTGQNFMFAGKEYSPEQANGVKWSMTNHDFIAKNALSVENGITLTDYFTLRNGLSGGTRPTWTKKKLPYDDWLTNWIADSDAPVLGKVPFDPTKMTGEELMNDSELKTVGALELTMAYLGYENPVQAAHALNPLIDIEETGGVLEDTARRNKIVWQDPVKIPGDIEGGLALAFTLGDLIPAGEVTEKRGQDPNDPRRTYITSSRESHPGDMYGPTGKISPWPSWIQLGGTNQKQFRNENFDNIFNGFYELLSGGDTVEMKRGMMPTSPKHKAQQTHADPRTSSTALAEAYNMLIFSTNMDTDQYGEPDKKHFAPHLKAFNTAPIPLPDKSWTAASPPDPTPSTFESAQSEDTPVSADAWGNFAEEQKKNLLDAGKSYKEGDKTTMKLDLSALKKQMGVPEDAELIFRAVPEKKKPKK